jgi:hypothetical protein
MTVLAVITSMILVVWFALQNSFAYSVDASHQREAARDAVSRMTVVIRDAQSASFSTGQVAAISKATSSEIVFNTSYAQSGNANVLSDSATSGNNNAVEQAAFIYVPSDGKIYYLVGSNDTELTEAQLADPSANGGSVIVDHLVNNANGTPVFTYTYFADDGTMTQTTQTTSLPLGVSPYTVQIHVLVDLNPGHTPVYMDLQSTAQPRNMRPST